MKKTLKQKLCLALVSTAGISCILSCCGLIFFGQSLATAKNIAIECGYEEFNAQQKQDEIARFEQLYNDGQISYQQFLSNVESASNDNLPLDNFMQRPNIPNAAKQEYQNQTNNASAWAIASTTLAGVTVGLCLASMALGSASIAENAHKEEDEFYKSLPEPFEEFKN